MIDLDAMHHSAEDACRLYYGVRSKQALAVLKVLHDQYCNLKTGK